jgi:hypothetical protein
MQMATEPQPERNLTLPDGTVLTGFSPVVIIGPNGSGKTRKARDINATCSVEFVNALRNTRIPLNLPAMAFTEAENQFVSSRNQSRGTHWDWTNEFDFLLSSLMAQHATAAIKFMDASKAGEEPSITPNALQQIRDLWGSAFPGRKLVIEDYRPIIKSTTSGTEVEYSAQTMSDGERTAIYLAGRVFRAQEGILIVDEPENHLHSHLASRLWDEFEDARPDLRFVYITHDLTFARSRRNATYVIASPLEGLRSVDLGADLPDDVAEVLLGAASVSFHARRAIFCEGGRGDRDDALYRSWFNDRDTVVQPVGSSEMVHRCISALSEGRMIGNLQTVGIIDRDFHTDEYLAALPDGIVVLPFHEVESLYCLPRVVEAIAAHTQRAFDEADYLTRLRGSINATERQKVVLERWKRRVEPQLIGVVAAVHGRQDTLDVITASLPQVFNSSEWTFDVAGMLEDEKVRVETASTTGSVEDLLRLLPGKGRLAAASQYVGMQIDGYLNLVNQSLLGVSGLEVLGESVRAGLAPHLPPRTAASSPDV